MAQQQTARDVELRVLASLIDKHTAKKAKAAAEREKLEGFMFTEPDLRDAFESYTMMGPDVFGGYILGTDAAELATAKPDLFMRQIVRAHNKRLREIDRTLDEFATPGRDEDDPDCLFVNRWMRNGACGMIISTSGVGKSTFTMQAATLWAAGADMLGIRPMRALKVGVVQSEDDEYDVANFRDKIRIGLKTEAKWDADKIAAAEARVTFCAWDGSTGARFVEYLKRKQRQHHFDVIIVNPLHAFFGGDLKNADEVSSFLRNGVDPMLKDEDTKCAVLFVHHTGKPSKDKIAEGDFFAGYMGSGSAELINYPRVALTITPYKEGKLPGVFNLIGSKHGDKLGWRDREGKPTNKKVVCYANRLDRHKTDGAIYWCEPDIDELEELEAAGTARTSGEGIYKTIATAIAGVFKARKITAPGTWVLSPAAAKDPALRSWTKRQRQAGWNLLNAHPETFGLVEVKDENTRAAWYEAVPTATTTEVPNVEF